MRQVISRRRLLYAAFAVAALGLLTQWFLHPSVLMRSDTLFHMNRILAIATGLAAGDLPVYVHGFQMQGYGTLDGALYPDLLLYLPATLVDLGASLSLAWNVHWVFLVCLSFFGLWRGYFLLTRRVYLGLVAALLYASPVFLMTYLGSGVGGYVAICFLPYVVGLLYTVLRRPDGARHWPELVFAFVVIAGEHVISFLLSLVLLAACLVLWRRGLRTAARRRALFLAGGFSLSLLLYRIVPFVYFNSRVDYWMRHVMIPSLSALSCDAWNLFLVQLWWGWPLVALLVAALLSPALRRRRRFLLMAALVALLTVMTWSGFPWPLIERIPPLGRVLPLFQFTYRFMALGLVPLVYFLARYLAVAGRQLCHRLPQGLRTLRHSARALVLLCALLAAANGMRVVANLDIMLGSLTVKWNDTTYRDYTAEDLIKGGATFSMDYVYADILPWDLLPGSPVLKPGEVRPIVGDLTVRSFEKMGTRLSFSYVSPTGAEALVPLFFYPGYVAQVDGERLTPRPEGYHVLALSLPAGEHHVSVRYRGPLSFRASAWFSLLSLVVFFIVSLRLWRSRHAP